MIRILLTATLFVAVPVDAQDVSGRARAVDGDTLEVGDVVTVRLHGIDAPEGSQTCTRQATQWRCGDDARAALARLVEGRDILCRQRDTDAYGRSVSVCLVGGVDVAGTLVDQGLAVALPQFSDAYVGREARAKAEGRGLWSSEFQMPADYRAAHPRSDPRPRAVLPVPRSYAAPQPSGTYFRNCREAWAAGAAPLRRGQPGYRPEMDGDGDGIACEPFRGR